jgi:hypothetical protein
LEIFKQTIPPNLKAIDITSLTHEKIFGSIHEQRNRIIKPAFTNDVNFVFISELTSMLGQREFMRHSVNLMNGVLEGEKVSRQTLMLAYGDIDPSELKDLSDKGVSYDAELGELSYKPNVCVFAATRPLDNWYFTHLSNSGHFSRYHVIQRRISDEDASLHLHREFRLDLEALNQLRELNEQLSQVKVRRMLRPTEVMMKQIYDSIEDIVKDEINSRRGLSLADIVTPRLKGDVIRELASHAFLRTAFQNGLKDINELRYSQEDVEFLMSGLYHFVDFMINPIVVMDLTYISKKRAKKDLTKELILAILSDKELRNGPTIVESAVEKIGCKGATAYNSLKELKIEGKICEPKYGFYKLKDDCKFCKYRDICLYRKNDPQESSGAGVNE